MNRRIFWIMIIVIALAAALRGFALGALALIGDESYYRLWSQQLGWSYFDHPAGVALMIRISTALGGDSEPGIRWLNSLLGVGCVFLTYLVGQRMLSRQAGLFAAIAVAVGAPFVITSRFAYTNVLNLFLMLLNLCVFARLCEEGRPSRTLAISFGVVLALLFNTTYSAYVYFAALIVAVTLDYRQLLTEPRFWAGIIVGVLGLLPVIAWNAAHDWVSFRWQLEHLTSSVSGEHSLLRNSYHGVAYLTWPLVALSVLGFGRLRNPSERLLSWLAVLLVLPVALSPANSPRNLTNGLVPLLLLAGTRVRDIRWVKRLRDLRTNVRRRDLASGGFAAAGLLLTALYGIGTVLNLLGPSSWPGSSVTSAISEDAAGWRDLGPTLAASSAPIFALDYSIASQIQHYADRPAHTAWGQYLIWGIPEFEDATIVSLDYVPDEIVSSRLSDAFRHVEGPQSLRFAERGATKEVHIWHAAGLQLNQQAFLERFDFLTLLEASR